MGLLDIVAPIIGGTEGQVEQAPLMSPQQQAALAELLPQLVQQYQTPQQFQDFTPQFGPAPEITQGPNIPTEFSFDPTYSPGFQQTLQSLLTGQQGPAYNITPETTQQYYEDVIRDPAVREFEETLRPQLLSGVSNLHSGHRQRLESEAVSDLMSGLRQQRGNLFYQDELARRESLQNAAQMQLQSQGLGLQTGLSQAGQQQQAQQAGAGMGLQAAGMQQQQWQALNNLLQQQYATQAGLGMGQAQFQLQQQAQQANLANQPLQNLLAALGLQTTENIVQPSALSSLGPAAIGTAMLI
jgi:hypothetical protein